jgi:hypothetical protein
MVELGFEEDEIRLHKTQLRLEDVVRTLQHSPKSDATSQGPSEVPTDL